MVVQDLVILGIIKDGLSGGIVMIVQQDVQHAMEGIQTNVRVVGRVIIFKVEIRALHVHPHVLHALMLQHVNHAKMAIIYQEPHVQHVILIV